MAHGELGTLKKANFNYTLKKFNVIFLIALTYEGFYSTQKVFLPHPLGQRPILPF